eukprot:GFYU01002258.1.p1 GENE.GFYU01002258.1~~GFYU01002258.1.p1  ORF type:complete len:288 (-),score=78.55 GFYU01002258.1:67-930(-)
MSVDTSFIKYHGAGNDFILIDDRDGKFPISNPNVVPSLCAIHTGVGADGVILLQGSEKADIRMRILQPDNSEAEMCGNGVRVLLQFAEDLGIAVSSVETMHRVLPVSSPKPGYFCVDMNPPVDVEWRVSIPIEYKGTTHNITVHSLDTGVPHCIVFVEDLTFLTAGTRLADIDVMELGPLFRRHPKWQPNGANANFIELDSSSGEVNIRTFERGVEGETLACGTGCTAAGIAAGVVKGAKAPVPVRVKSGDKLDISYDIRTEADIQQVTMSGAATRVYKGVVPIPQA